MLMATFSPILARAAARGCQQQNILGAEPLGSAVVLKLHQIQETLSLYRYRQSAALKRKPKRYFGLS